jgi:ribosomal-protein-alanine N-acetyltransferase
MQENMRVPTLETERLLIRPLSMDDLPDVYQLFDIELQSAQFGSEGAKTLTERESWLRWTVLSYEELAKLNQPPYGERAVVLKQAQQIIGACGFVPSFAPFEQLPAFRSASQEGASRFSSPEFGLFYAFAPGHQRQGYATEATRALIDYAFSELGVRRIVATTTYDNAASMGVMRKVGMRIETNPYPEPPWLQVVGLLENSTINTQPWKTVQ